eukprot:10310319-Lingulodinium_polyedra.AAC.1
MRRPPCGGQRVERAFCESRGAARMECVPKRMSAQLLRESCSEIRSETRAVAAVLRISQNARSTRRPP